MAWTVTYYWTQWQGRNNFRWISTNLCSWILPTPLTSRLVSVSLKSEDATNESFDAFGTCELLGVLCNEGNVGPPPSVTSWIELLLSLLIIMMVVVTARSWSRSCIWSNSSSSRVCHTPNFLLYLLEKMYDHKSIFMLLWQKYPWTP